MKALRIEVERVVRPLRASPRRKDRIREELLAHLTRLYDEELVRTGDDKLAVSVAVRRFGDAPQLTRELQENIPWLERWAFFPIFEPFRRRIGESPARYVVRCSRYGAIFSLIGYSLIALLCIGLSGVRPHRIDEMATSHILLTLFGTAAIQTAAFLALAFLGELTRQALETPTPADTAGSASPGSARLPPSHGRLLNPTIRILFYSVISSSIVLGTSIAFLMLLINANFPFPFISRPQFWWITLGFALLGVPYSILVSLSWQATVRRYENWESLDLTQDPT
jgi:hypothetical protein